MKIPQADDITKIMDLPLGIADGKNTSKLIAKRYEFDERQSNYYLEAVEMLGLASRRLTKYFLTEDGQKYLLMDVPQRKLMLIRKMIIVPIISRIVAELFASEKRILRKEDLERLIEESARVGGSTVPRRAQTILAWFRWLGEEAGIVHVDADSVRMSMVDRPMQSRG